jgi:hypothetical protein
MPKNNTITAIGMTTTVQLQLQLSILMLLLLTTYDSSSSSSLILILSPPLSSIIPISLFLSIEHTAYSILHHPSP